MKAELVELVTKGRTETVVLISTQEQAITQEEKREAAQLTVWLVDEGWTVTTRADSPLADVVRRAAQAMRGKYRDVPSEEPNVTVSQHQLSPRARALGSL
ncbi:hypothetical protein GCM10027568_30330 [Humibacter soli]